jgi:hypothetical protein
MIGCHLQIFAIMINWTSLICVIIVSVVCSLLMWTTQIEEAMVHEKNFRESITMLVVPPNESESESDKEIKEDDDEDKVVSTI